MTSDNGNTWVWVAASIPGVGDAAFQIPEPLTRSSKLPEEFNARRLTFFRPLPTEDGGSNIVLHKSMFMEIGVIGEQFRMRAESLAYWSIVNQEHREKLDSWWSPVAVPTQIESARILRGLNKEK